MIAPGLATTLFYISGAQIRPPRGLEGTAEEPAPSNALSWRAFADAADRSRGIQAA